MRTATPHHTRTVDEDDPIEVHVSLESECDPKMDHMHQWALDHAPDHRLRLEAPSTRMWCFQFSAREHAETFHALFGGRLLA